MDETLKIFVCFDQKSCKSKTIFTFIQTEQTLGNKIFKKLFSPKEEHSIGIHWHDLITFNFYWCLNFFTEKIVGKINLGFFVLNFLRRQYCCCDTNQNLSRNPPYYSVTSVTSDPDLVGWIRIRTSWAESGSRPHRLNLDPDLVGWIRIRTSWAESGSGPRGLNPDPNLVGWIWIRTSWAESGSGPRGRNPDPDLVGWIRIRTSWAEYGFGWRSIKLSLV
jgi:hypothetical protein